MDCLVDNVKACAAFTYESVTVRLLIDDISDRRVSHIVPGGNQLI